MKNISGKLCTYDPRNPNRIQLDESDYPVFPNPNCYCDNCFYGRTDLANQLLDTTKIGIDLCAWITQLDHTHGIEDEKVSELVKKFLTLANPK